MTQSRKSNRAMEFRNHFKNEASLKSQTSKGNILKVFFVIVISALLFACNKNDEKPDDSIKKSKIELFANSSDPLLMRCTTDNSTAEYYGGKLDNGMPISLDYICVNDKNNNEQTFFYFENENLKKIIMNDGTDYSFNWITQNKAEITLTFTDGLQILQTVSFEDNLSTTQFRSAKLLKSAAANNDGIVSVSTCGTANNESSVYLNVNLKNGESPRKILCTNIGNGKYKFNIPYIEKSDKTIPISDYCNAVSSTTKITKFLPTIVAVICGAEFLAGVLLAPETLGGSLSFTVHSFTACPVAAVAALGYVATQQDIPCPDDYSDYIPSEISVIPEVLFRGKTYYGNTVNLQLLNGSIVDVSKLNNLNVQVEISDNELVKIAGEEVKSNEAFIYMNIAFNCGEIQGGSIVYSSTNTNPTIGGSSCMLAPYNDGYTPAKLIKISNLIAETEYYVRAYVQTSSGNFLYSSVKKIKTLPDIKLNLSISNITQTSASCNITINGVAEITDKGICWNTSGNPTINSNCINKGADFGNFSSNISGLQPNTKYYVKGFVKTKDGNYIYSNEVLFTTLEEEQQGNLCTINGDWSGWQKGSFTTSAPGFSQTTPIDGGFGFVVENCKIQAGSYQVEGMSMSFSGSMTGNNVKIYLTTTGSGISQNWTYTGQLNATKNKISGTWTLSASYSSGGVSVTQSGRGTWEVTKQ